MNTKTRALNKLNQKSSTKSRPQEMKQQYDIIRNDLLKLREDLSKGYDMARTLIDRKNLKEFLNSKK